MWCTIKRDQHRPPPQSPLPCLHLQASGSTPLAAVVEILCLSEGPGISLQKSIHSEPVL